ncbi:MAG: GNAT family N-acetyltransferase [Bryobacteraceae bacterium]
MKPAFRMEPLRDGHDRTAFSCGEPALDRYFQTQATQDIRRRVATCFVAVESETGSVAAYYTLASASIPLTSLPESITRKLPRYPSLPAVRIGRLAVDLRFRGRKVGSAMLADALQRVVASGPATYAFLVDAKDDSAAAFYRHHGFSPLQGLQLTLFLPVATALKASI